MKPILPFANVVLRFLGKIASPAAIVLAVAIPSDAGAQARYQTPQAAITAFVDAVRSGDRQLILTVIGRRGADIVTSGDDVADAEARLQFLAAYDAKHDVSMDGDNKATLVVGRDDFPFPIPLIRSSGTWTFDTATGRLEILRRRIGRNELAAIQACLAYVDAQNEYAAIGHDNAAAGVYAQRIVSQIGKKDGLYWPTAPGEVASPLGGLFARATSQGYVVDEQPAPFHGYYYKILTKQGANAPGGAMDYVVRGKMIGGFALVAYPAAYRNSGVMTFIVNHDGVLFQKDLGERTATIAEQMSSFDPVSGWNKVESPTPSQ